MKKKEANATTDTTADTADQTSENPESGKPEHKFENQRFLDALKAVDLNSNGWIVKDDLVRQIQRLGLHHDDPRLHVTYRELARFGDRQEILLSKFAHKVSQNSAILTRALNGDLIVPEFADFTDKVGDILNTVRGETSGAVADYIPQLKKVDPEKLGLSICTVDGQYFSTGDCEDTFCLQSTCKPLLYALALEEHSEDDVHRHIGREPSGARFNELTLNETGLPHNPMINAGAIMSCSLIKQDKPIADRFDYVMSRIQAMAGFHTIGFDNSVYLSEKETGDRNFALGYFMRENKSFPANTDLIKTIEFYFQCCAITLTTRGLASIAGTIANSGIQPLTGEKVYSPGSIKNCLSLMLTCGMYDYSGEWAFLIGLPAKSGVSGAIMAIIPGIMGICIWSPRLNEQGNSVRGIEFFKHLTHTFALHQYDSVIKSTGKRDPLARKTNSSLTETLELVFAASMGDINEIIRLVAKGVNLDAADYDGRTALHLAASEGRNNVIEYLVSKGVNLSPVDRWNYTPLDDAKRHNHRTTVELLTHHMKKP